MPFSGPTHGRAELVIVGEAPGAQENRDGVPFVGKAGKVLDRSLELAGTQRSKVAVMNVICCRPPNNRDPLESEVSACRPHFNSQLDIIGVPFGLALGRTAIYHILGSDIWPALNKTGMSSLTTWVTYRHNMVWMFGYHPAYVARQPQWRGPFTKQIQLALEIVRGDQGVFDDRRIPLNEVEVEGWTKDLRDRLRLKGWANVSLQGLQGEVVRVIRDPHVIHPQTDLTTYTIDELVRLGEIGRGWRSDMERIHAIKSQLGGQIVA